MRKITLLFMLLCSVITKAATEELSIEGFNCWGNGDDPVTYQCSKSGSTITFNQNWGGGSWWLTEKDASKYQTIEFKFNALSKPVYFHVEYGHTYIKDEKTCYYYTEATAEAGETSISLTLNTDYKDKVRQVSIRSTDDYEGCSITLDKVYFYGVPEFPTGSSALALSEDNGNYWFSESEISAYSGSTVSIEGTPSDEKFSGWDMGIIHNNKWNGSAWDKSTTIGSWGTTTTTVSIDVATLEEYVADDGYIHMQGWSGTLNSATVYYDQVSITIGAAGYATMMLPFAASIPDGMKVYTTELNDGKNAIVLTEANAIEANIPYIVGGTAKDYTFKGVSTATEYSYSGSVLTGTYESSLDITEGDYILYNGGSGIGFYPAGSGVTISQCHAYLPASVLGSSGESKLRFVFADDATGIAQTATEKATVVARYTLGGTRISAPQSGINIVKMSDGTVRKVIVK